MKNALGAGVLLVSLAGCTQGPAPIEAPILGWQGEWGEWTAEDHAQTYGASISISGCDSAAHTCRFRYNSESPQSRCGGSDNDRNLLLINDSRARAEFVNDEGKPSGCYLELEKVEWSARKELRLLAQAGAECAKLCTGGRLDFPPAYPFRTTTVYPAAASRDCFADRRKSRAVWCGDERIQELDQRLGDLDLRIDSLKHTNDYRRAGTFRGQILAECDRAADARDCLLSGYTKAVSDAERSEKNVREAHDRDLEALKTPGDPVEASRLIARVEGVYRRRFQNARADGRKYMSENMLEIARVSEDTVYFRTRLEAYNTSTCSLSGLAPGGHPKPATDGHLKTGHHG